VTTESNPDQADTAANAEQASSGWSPMDCLRSLGRAASIAAGTDPNEADGFRIITESRDGDYYACITHYLGKAIRLPMALRHQLESASFPSAEEAAQHARFLIASGALNSIRHG
jgi:hypothetical protein